METEDSTILADKDGIIYRYANGDEREGIGYVYMESWKAAYRGIIPDTYLDSLTVQNCMPVKLTEKANIAALKDGNTVGIVNFGKGRDTDIIPANENKADSLEDDKNHIGEIRAIYVCPDYLKKGIGRTLFTLASDEMKKRGYKTFYLWVLRENIRARGFYEKMNMTESGIERIINISGKDLSEVMYIHYFG